MRASAALSILICLACLSLPRPAAAVDLPPQTEAAITRYLTELSRVENAPERTSMEALFEMTDSLNQYLCNGELYSRTSYGQTRPLPTIEDLSDADYDSLCTRLRGMALNRSETVFAEADSATFLPLARAKGLPADRGFMVSYFATRPMAWPAYVVQETDFSGCNDYGSGAMVDIYARWRRFRAEHAGSYERASLEQWQELRRLFRDPGNPCGGPGSVLRELALFLDRFADEDIAPEIRDSMTAIREGRSAIRFPAIPK